MDPLHWWAPWIATLTPSRRTSVLFSATAPGLQDFRKNGPMGKLHNTGVALHRSSQLHDLFIQAQLEAATQVAKESNLDTEEPIPTLEFVHNVVTRWQSDRAMVNRASLLGRPISYFFYIIEEK
ncbi:hypothetical protein EDB80DRAFT_732258 [Ilyonectria destructans]|nr:hypothetical protein EDB80DRAFT_732258 [Ilyonectria destructans]